LVTLDTHFTTHVDCDLEALTHCGAGVAIALTNANLLLQGLKELHFSGVAEMRAVEILLEFQKGILKNLPCLILDSFFGVQRGVPALLLFNEHLFELRVLNDDIPFFDTDVELFEDCLRLHDVNRQLSGDEPHFSVYVRHWDGEVCHLA
jgi:hypothetical protein